MKILVGTENIAKLKAVREAINESPYFWEFAEIQWHKVESGVADQPKTIEETLKWAKWRVKNLQKEYWTADFYIWLEWWVTQIDNTAFLFWFAAIWDGENIYSANSSMIPLPEDFRVELFENDGDIWEIPRKVTGDEKITHKWGTFWELTDGHMTRDVAFKQAIHCAFPAFFNKYYK